MRTGEDKWHLFFEESTEEEKGKRRERDDEGWAVNDTLRPSVSLSPLWSHAYMTSSREGRMAMLGVEVSEDNLCV